MKYFMITLNPKCQHVPEIENWNQIKAEIGLFGKNDIFDKIHDRIIIPVSTIEQTVWADVLVSPIFLISKLILTVIQLCGDPIYYKEVVLLDQEHAVSKIYMIPKLETVLGFMEHGQKDKPNIPEILIKSDQKVIKWSNIFQVIDGAKQYTIINLDMAESILRRGAEGIGLEEVKILIK